VSGTDGFWDLPALGELPPEERGAFYDAIAEDEKSTGRAGFAGLGDSAFFENPGLKVGLIEGDSVVAATGYTRRKPIRNSKINLFLERYFAYQMPGRDFDLQLMIGSHHHFAGRKEPSEVTHTFAVAGREGDYVPCLGAALFGGLSIRDNLLLRIGVTYLGDRTRDEIVKHLNSEGVKKGLLLATGYNPIFGAAASYAQSIAVALVNSKFRNRKITRAEITLSGSPGAISIPLVEGTYVLVQPKRDEQELSFSNLRLNPSRDGILLGNQPLKRNHMMIRVQPLGK